MRSPLKPTGTQNIRELEKMNKRRTLDRDNFMLCILMQTFLFKPLKRSCNKLESTWEYGRRSLVLSCKLGQQLYPQTTVGLTVTLHFLEKYIGKSAKHLMQSSILYKSGSKI